MTKVATGPPKRPLKELSGIVRTVCRRQGAGPNEPTFEILTTPNPKQQRAYGLLKTIAV